MEKAIEEYKKYKTRTLSDVEKDYIESVGELTELAKKMTSKRCACSPGKPDKCRLP